MNRNIINRIAGKICLAYTYRYRGYNNGFENKSKNGIVVFNYYHFPVIYAYPLDNGNVKIIHCVSEKDAFDNYNYPGSKFSNNKFVNLVQSQMSGYGNNIRNFRICVFNQIYRDGGISGDAGAFLYDTESEVTMEDAKNMLTGNYDVPLNLFCKFFGGENEGGIKVIESNGFSFQVNGSDFTDEEIVSMAGQVYNKVPSSLKNLCYGKVEVKKAFNKNAIGDYNSGEDIIRTGGERDDFVGIMLHELGHRWRYKLATKQQLTAFKKIYDNANGREIKLNPKDIITYNWGKDYKFISYWGKSLYMEEIATGEKKLFKGISTRSMEKINGQAIDKIEFPTNYSKTDFDEFVAECFEEYCMGRLNDGKLKDFVSQQFK